MSVIVARDVAQCCAATVGCGPAVPAVARTVLIYPGQTEIVDEVPYSQYLALKWLVDLTSITTTDQRSLAYEMYAVHRYGTNPSYNVYSMVGEPTSHTRSVSIVGPNLRFTITNTSATDVYLAAVTRIPIISSVLVAMILAGAYNPTIVPFTQLSYTIPAATTTIVDTLSFTRYLASKWIANITNTTTGDTRAIEIYGNQQLTGDAHYNVYSEMGDLIDYQISAAMSGNDYELSIENQSATDSYEVRLIRKPVVLDPSILCCLCNCGSFNVIPINDAVIPASSTLNVDSVTVASACSVKWLILLRNPTTDEARVYQVHATREGLAAIPSYNVYSLVGDSISAVITVTISGGLFRLNIENQETDDLVFDGTRIIVNA